MSGENRQSILSRLGAEPAGPLAPPRKSGELVFETPWEARVFGIAVSLCEQGLYQWDEFRRCLIAEIQDWEGRSGAARRSAQPLRELLAADHRRLSRSARQCLEGAAGSGAAGRARTDLLEFVRGLRRHVRLEEQLLFPALARAAAPDKVPSAELRAEHRGIEAMLDRLAALVEADDDGKIAATAARELPELLSLLDEHDRKEEETLYPAADGVIADPDRRRQLILTVSEYNYYERWLAALERCLVDKKLLGRDQIERRALAAAQEGPD